MLLHCLTVQLFNNHAIRKINKNKKGKLKIIKVISRSREVACLQCHLVGYLLGNQTGFLNLSNHRRHQIQNDTASN